MSTTSPKTGIQYPNFGKEVHPSIQAAFRTAYDNLFSLRDQVEQLQSQQSVPATEPGTSGGPSLVRAVPLPNGSNRKFEFGSPPIAVFVAGVLLQPGVDYIQLGRIISTATAPGSPDAIYGLILI